MSLKLSDYDFTLPPELIAFDPPRDRPSAKLLYISRETGEIAHGIFRDVPKFFKAGDVLVLNNTKVMPARLIGKKESGGKVEALLLKEIAADRWRALLRPGGRIKKGMRLQFGDNETRLDAEVLEDSATLSGEREIQFMRPSPSPLPEGEGIRTILRKIGHMPLPPYINRPDTHRDREMYQTVFAEHEGAVASPTAGLHFDKALLETLAKKGVEIVCVTLHVSYGTFQPISAEDITQHQMFSEEYEVTEEAAEKVNKALAEGRRVIACGTTSVRTLESACLGGRPKATYSIQPGKGETRIFIYPGFEFKVVKGLITNFHIPKSSLLLLVAGFLGKDRMFAAYKEAINRQYRFYSYGDAMLIL